MQFWEKSQNREIQNHNYLFLCFIQWQKRTSIIVLLIIINTCNTWNIVTVFFYSEYLAIISIFYLFFALLDDNSIFFKQHIVFI